MIRAHAERDAVQGGDGRTGSRQFIEQGLHRTPRCEPVPRQQDAMRDHLHAREGGFQIGIHSSRGVTIAQADLRPIADQAACFVAGESVSAAVQKTATIRKPGQELEGQRKKAAFRCRKRAPVRRTGSDQPQFPEGPGIQGQIAGCELSADAVAADGADRRIAMPRDGGMAAWQVQGQDLAITPIHLAAGAHAAAAVAAPFVQEDGNATRGQGFGKRQVMFRGDAERRQPQHGTVCLRRDTCDQVELVAVVRGQRDLEFRHAHRDGAAPK